MVYVQMIAKPNSALKVDNLNYSPGGTEKGALGLSFDPQREIQL